MNDDLASRSIRRPSVSTFWASAAAAAVPGPALLRAINHAAEDWSGFRSKDDRRRWLISALTDLSESFADSCRRRSSTPSKRTVIGTGSSSRFLAVVRAIGASPCYHTDGYMICARTRVETSGTKSLLPYLSWLLPTSRTLNGALSYGRLLMILQPLVDLVCQTLVWQCRGIWDLAAEQCCQCTSSSLVLRPACSRRWCFHLAGRLRNVPPLGRLETRW